MNLTFRYLNSNNRECLEIGVSKYLNSKYSTIEIATKKTLNHQILW